ncbi:MAG: hypothetical protein O2890_10920 [Cyanobacteria bacterium]|nr:hypothetical protein [Cyanobacteriota bacterium]MDA0866910.1 hypothetical protein [Cyanobacteriota bacterium]
MAFKIKPIIAAALSLPLALSVAWEASSQEVPCQAYTVETGSQGYGFEEVNTCPLDHGNFSIQGIFANDNWDIEFFHWEPAAYLYRGINLQDGTSMQLIDFDVVGTSSRPQYRFTDGNLTYTITFRYSDPDMIRFEVHHEGFTLVNELLERI